MTAPEVSTGGVEVDLTLRNLTRDEALSGVKAMSVGETVVVVRHPVIVGGARYSLAFSGLTIATAAGLSRALLEHGETVGRG